MLSSSNPLPELLEARLTPDRLASYRLVTGGNRLQALDLYKWNSEIAAALFKDLGHLEVFLRNALDDQLTLWHATSGPSGHWFENQTGPLGEHRQADIAKARKSVEESARRKGVAVGPDKLQGQVIASLMLGFWTFLLDTNNERPLWTYALRHAFPYLSPQERARVHRPLTRLKNLRNRIAHQEPIHTTNLGARYAELLRIIGWIEPNLAG